MIVPDEPMTKTLYFVASHFACIFITVIFYYIVAVVHGV